MNTKNLRVVTFLSGETKQHGIFHRWIQKNDDTILALVEDLSTGKVVFLKTDDITFLGFHDTLAFWSELEGKPIF